MNLLVDIGNSRLKWARASGTDLGETGAAEYGAGLGPCLERSWANLESPERVVVCNVGGETAAAVLTGWSLGRWGVAPEFVTARAAGGGVRNAYTEPERLGADRWAALVGARHLFGGAACVADCGTAVTIDALSISGEHLGGLILPGLAMMRDALLAGTRGIRPEGEAEVSLLARNTAGAVAGGTLYALVAALDRIAADVAAELGEAVECVITGGDAPLLAPLLAGRWSHEPRLVLQGVAVLVQEGAVGTP